MKLYLAFILVFIFDLQCAAQNNKSGKTYTCNTGKVHFYSSAPVQDVEANSATGECVINAETKKVSAKVKMESFEFRRKLMQSHFNEEYVESNKYPYALLDAVIVEKIDFSKDGVYDVTLKGTFEIHGTKRDLELKGKLTVKNGQPYSAIAKFDIRIADYNIKIPTLVFTKIAQVVAVDVNFEFGK